jgi:hypothetical protein
MPLDRELLGTDFRVTLGNSSAILAFRDRDFLEISGSTAFSERSWLKKFMSKERAKYV